MTTCPINNVNYGFSIFRVCGVDGEEQEVSA